MSSELGYSKESQVKKKVRSHRTCKKCGRLRLIRFYEKSTSLVCNQCKKEAKRIKKQLSPTKLKQKAWKAFSDYIRTRDSIKTTGTTTHCVCITCNKNFEYKNIQAGHFVGGRTGSILFDEELVFGQCVGCNVFLKGNYDAYNLVMLKKFGGEKVIEFLERKNEVVQYKASDYQAIIKKYEKKLSDLLVDIVRQ